MRITIDVSDEFAARLKLSAERDEVSLEDLISDSLRRGIRFKTEYQVENEKEARETIKRLMPQIFGKRPTDNMHRPSIVVLIEE